jgi:hypothetical protein
MNAEEVLDLWERIKVRWPNWKAPEDLALGVEIYLEDLGAHDYDRVKKAYRALRDSPFPPSLGQVVAEIEDDGLGEAWMANTYSKTKPGDFFYKDDPLA